MTSVIRCRHSATAILVAATVAGCAVSGDKAGGTRGPPPTILALSHALDDAEIRPFLDEVDRQSGGSVRIEPHSVARTASGDDDATVVDEVLAGHAELGITSTLVAPLEIDSLSQQERVLRGALAIELVAPKGLDKIGALPGPLIRPAGTHAMLGPADYRGARMAMKPSDSAQLRALGANAVPHNLRGTIAMVDAMAAPVSTIARNVYDGDLTTLTTNVILGARPLIVFGRHGLHGKLLRAAAKAAIPAATELRRTEENTALAALCQRARVELVTATDSDISALRSAFGLNPPTQANAPPPDIPTCAGFVRSTETTLIDGLYFIDAGDETQWLTLDRGRFAGNFANGSYTVHGNLLTMTPSTGLGTMVYRWIPYGDELTLYPVEGRNSPEALRIRPWQRLGDTPVPSPTRLDGVYEVATSSGRYRWTLDRGQFHQNRDGQNLWAVGGYIVAGNVLSITYSQLGGEGKTSGPVKSGDTVSYQWNLYRGQLHLSPVAGAYSPAVFSDNAWRRTGDAP